MWLSGNLSDLSPLARHAKLTSLAVWSATALTGLGVLAELPALTMLTLGSSGFEDIEFVRSAPGLTSLRLHDLDAVTDFSPLRTLTRLNHLSIETPKTLTSFESVRNIPTLLRLTLRGHTSPPGGLPQLAAELPRLITLNLFEADWLTDLEPIGRFEHLDRLTLRSGRLSSIAAVEQVPNLQFFDLDCPQVDDISVIGKLTKLKTLYLREPAARVDPVALSMKDTTVHVPDRPTAQRWRRVPGQAAKIKVIDD
ncbi:hypothetical protein LWC34_31840 [Kibdelosporangium philippinense]|uniref:Leucine-rich repeat domain-containing protein n=1 Tax=Kibdelosporangium philippinense TaxID=211113 RepID=A0ABS8ZK78_9PSEU|nr:hypothetical protein [Kibdelosporangium philippinense]MCE7007375.1 hypothetical protein [Kibdelosporangium philippinense]